MSTLVVQQVIPGFRAGGTNILLSLLEIACEGAVVSCCGREERAFETFKGRR